MGYFLWASFFAFLFYFHELWLFGVISAFGNVLLSFIFFFFFFFFSWILLLMGAVKGHAFLMDV